jgi:hypothetical protein
MSTPKDLFKRGIFLLQKREHEFAQMARRNSDWLAE